MGNGSIQWKITKVITGLPIFKFPLVKRNKKILWRMIYRSRFLVPFFFLFLRHFRNLKKTKKKRKIRFRPPFRFSFPFLFCLFLVSRFYFIFRPFCCRRFFFIPHFLSFLFRARRKGGDRLVKPSRKKKKNSQFFFVKKKSKRKKKKSGDFWWRRRLFGAFVAVFRRASRNDREIPGETKRNQKFFFF